jgi:ankyrin repeat protein
MDLNDTPNEEGKTTSCVHAAAHYQDPYWYDESGRNPLVAHEIFELAAGEVRTRHLQEIVHEYERYGATMYEVAAEADRADIIRPLLELGADPNVYVAAAPERDVAMAGADDGEDDNGDDSFYSPKFTVNPPLSGAAIAGRLECVKVLVDEVGVSIDEPDASGGSTALLYAMGYGHVEVVKFLLSRGASIVTPEGFADMVALALKRGNADVAEAVIESEQWKASGVEINLGHLRYTGQGGNIELVQLVLSSCSVPPPTGNLGDLTESQRDAILRTISFAIQAGVIDCLRFLLLYATRQRPDASYEYFQGDAFYDHVNFQLLEEAIPKRDDPETFRIVWETMVCHPDAGPSDPYSPSPMADGTPSLTKDEAIHRLLIMTAHHGRLETLKLIHEYYGADVNYIGHPWSSTCLGRAAGAVEHDLPGRLAVVRYLLENTNADLTIAQGNYANGPTPLFLAVTQLEGEMVQLLLEFGGPVESVDESLYRCIEGMQPGGELKFCVACYESKPRCPVKIWAPQHFEKTSNSKQVKRLYSEWQGDELLVLLKGLKTRSSDAELLRTDPEGRPLANAARAAKIAKTGKA